MKMDEIKRSTQPDEIDDRRRNAQLDEEEYDILESYERDEWVSASDKEAVIDSLKTAAANTLRKDRRVNIRITNRDLLALQEIAQEEGLPYQTLMASILHKYVTGRLVERPRRLTSPASYLVHEESEPYDE